MKEHPRYKDYFITPEGGVYSARRGGLKKLSPNVNNGYRTVCLCHNKDRKMRMVHRLVAETFLPNPHNLPEVNHLDENKNNNHVSNLEWCTKGDNMRHSCAHTWQLFVRSTGEEFEVFSLNKFAKSLGTYPEKIKEGYHFIGICRD